MFDPEKVRRYYWDDNDVPEGVVSDEDYDKLLELYRETERQLRQERGLKALLGNGMPDTGDAVFDEVLMLYPVAEMIQRGWLEGIVGFDDLPALKAAICKFFRVGNLSDTLKPLQL